MADNGYRLKTKEGKFLIMSNTPQGMELRAIDTQNPKGKWIFKEIRMKISLHFKNDTDSYALMVRDTKLTGYANFSSDSRDEFLFRRENVRSGEHYCLQSMCEPYHFICYASGRALKLSDNKEQRVLIKHEKIL